MDAQSIIAKTQAERAASIPEPWRLRNAGDTTARPIDALKQSGLLSQQEIKITEQNGTELLEKIQSGALTAVAVVEAFCKRAAIAHQVSNCLTEFFPSDALKRAQELDDELKGTGKTVGPLHGLPIAIKDMYAGSLLVAQEKRLTCDRYDVQGRLTTVGFVYFHDRRATSDASLVKVMQDAGAVIFAKTTMPQTGMALETYSNLWGRTLNTYSTKFGSGGSSGGDGVLVGLRGAPFAPLASDIGGSIRAPAAFNGLYGIRPTADRIPRKGLKSAVSGQISIKTSCGPIAHDLADLKLLTRLILTHPSLPFEGSCPPGRWDEVRAPRRPLRIGLMSTDGVVEPHPPVARALKEAADKLKAAGHEVFEFKPPFDLWQAALTTWALYFQTGGVEIKEYIEKAGESMLPVHKWHTETFKTRPLTTQEVYKLNTTQLEYKWAFADAWQATASASDLALQPPIDAILCPPGPMAGVPHDFPVWWGYTSLWNLLDYPSTIIPLKDFQIDPTKDKKDLGYVPRDNNPFDRPNWEVYDPELWKTQPVAVQVVGRPWKDEDLVAVSEVIDQVVNTRSQPTSTDTRHQHMEEAH